MALLVGAKLESVAVVPQKTSNGRTRATAPSPWAEVMTAVAGHTAELIAFGHDEEPDAVDLALAQPYLGGVSIEEFQSVARWMLEMHWASVLTLEDALMRAREMSGEQVKALLDNMRPKAAERPTRVER